MERRMLTKAEVRRHFDAFAVGGRWSTLYDEDGDAVTNYSFIVRRRRVETLLGPLVGAGSRVLDMACGTGVLAPFIAGRGACYHGIDRSEPMIAQARRRFARQNGGGLNGRPAVEFAVGDVAHIDAPDGHFDAVLALGLFEYLQDADRAADELVRVTRPGGLILVSVPTARCADAWACRVFSPVVTTAMWAVRRLAGRRTRADRFSNRRFSARELDRLFRSRACEKSAQAFYNVEVACYPFRRLFPAASLRLKRRAEPSADGLLRPFATAYIGSYRRRDDEGTQITPSGPRPRGNGERRAAG